MVRLPILIIAACTSLLASSHARGESASITLMTHNAQIKERQRQEQVKLRERQRKERLAIATLKRLGDSRQRELQMCAKGEGREVLNGLPPVRDQGLTGWCYAMVAADLASFGTGENASAASFAIRFGDYQSKNWRTARTLTDLVCDASLEIGDGGAIDWATYLGARHGEFCTESQLPSTAFGRLQTRDFDRMVKELNVLKAKRNNECGHRGHPLGRVFAHSLIAIGAMSETGLGGSLQEFADARCTRPVRTRLRSMPTMETYDAGPNYRRLATQRIIAQVGNNKLPAGVAMNIASLLKPSCKDGPGGILAIANAIARRRPVCDALTAKPDEAFHAMTAVGSTVKNGVCNIRLRNSWGGDCSCFNTQFKCTREYIEVPADLVQSNLLYVTLPSYR